MEYLPLYADGPGKIGDKLTCLMEQFAISRAQFLIELQSHVKKIGGAAFDTVKIDRLINGDEMPSEEEIGWLTGYWRRYYTDIDRDFWHIRSIYSVSAVFNYVKERSNAIIRGEHLLSEFAPDTFADLVGEYTVYRYSLNNDGSISKEYMAISEIPGSKLGLRIQYRQPSIYRNSESDDFTGQIHQVGQLIWGFSHYARGQDRRLQNLYLPLTSPFGRRVRWGLLIGTSAKHSVPVSVRFIAEKSSNSVSIQKKHPERIPFEDVPEVYRGYISNEIWKDDILPVSSNPTIGSVALSVGQQDSGE